MRREDIVWGRARRSGIYKLVINVNHAMRLAVLAMGLVLLPVLIVLPIIIYRVGIAVMFARMVHILIKQRGRACLAMLVVAIASVVLILAVLLAHRAFTFTILLVLVIVRSECFLTNGMYASNLPCPPC